MRFVYIGGYAMKILLFVLFVILYFCRYCQILGMVLNQLSLECVVLHSMIPQKQRLASLAKFKSDQIKVLVATDVASR